MIDMLKKYSHYIICLMLWVVLTNGANAQGPECFFVHFDKPFYVSGETIWFKVYRLGPTTQVSSRVLHIDLVDHRNQLIAKQKLRIENGAANGSIELPLGTAEGLYRFRAITRYNLNFESSLIYKANIPVYQLDQATYPVSQLAEDTQDSDAEGVLIAIERPIYQPRDSLRLSFQVNGSDNLTKDGSYSISILPSELLVPRFDFYHQLQCPDISPEEGRLLQPERSMIVHGTVHNPETQQPVTSRLLSIYVDKTSQLIRASSRDGNIRVAIPDYWGTGTFQVLNLDPYNPQVLKAAGSSDLEVEDPYINEHSPRRTGRVLNYLDKLAKRRKIVELFDLYRPYLPDTSSTTPKVPDAIYRTEDFKQIYNFEQFINNAIQNVKVRMEDGTKTVRLFNRERGQLFEDHPWYLVDGFLSFNEEEVLQIPIQDIIEIRLYSKTSTLDRYFQGFMQRSGVMEIVTRDVKYLRDLKSNPNIIEIDGYTQARSFQSSIGLAPDKNTPDLRGIMYWAPEVMTNAQGMGEITIPLSDDTGIYSIVIMGTNNRHHVVTGYKTFEIKLE